MIVQPIMNDLPLQDILELARQGHREQAREALKALLREDAMNANAWLALAQVADNKQDAILCLQRVVRLQPENQRALNALARLQDSPPARVAAPEPIRPASNLPIIVLCGVAIILLLIFGGLVMNSPDSLSQWIRQQTNSDAALMLDGTAKAPATTPVPDYGDLIIESNTEYYPVTGNTVRELQQSLYGGSLHMPGGDAWAYTQSEFEFAYETQSSRATGCALSDVTVTLHLTYKYPRWEPGTQPTQEAQYAWQPFIYALIRHEEHHGAIAASTGRKFLNALRALPAEPNCDSLSNSISATLNRIDAEGRQRQAEWDQQEGPLPFPIQ
jgi:predicted secreted Zn-dependent protease